MKLVENGRIRKKEEGIAGFRKGEFRCIQAAVAYWHDPYKKRGTFLATQNRGLITNFKKRENLMKILIGL